MDYISGDQLQINYNTLYYNIKQYNLSRKMNIELLLIRKKYINLHRTRKTLIPMNYIVQN